MTFRKRMWLILLGALAVGLAVHAPNGFVSLVAHRKTATWHAAAEAALGDSATMDEVVAWLKTESDRASGPGPYTGPTGSGKHILSERVLAKGTWLWEPATARLDFYFDSAGNLRESESRMCPFRASFVLGNAPSTWVLSAASMLPLAALVIIFALNVRRYLRREYGKCIECGYDLRGDLAAGCPECGWKRELAATASEHSESAVRS